ncbi:MAG: septal ring lytic transglycosylase RlpA family protein [Chrysiogenales bacterium]|nr:MAG: septal ring lytic transglycosylase RlpA family protein [Chrysiogenales bacterium]
MKKLLRVAAYALLLVFSACSAKTGIRSQPEFGPPAVAQDSLNVFQTGIASWYGDDFNGKTTANGEIYDMSKLTAAHQNLPFHTLVEVENLENKKKVLVRVNDRGPFLKNRIIDLSWQAAQRLEMAEQGTAEVKLRVLRWGGATIDGQTPANGGLKCFVQAGAFSVRENAEDMLLTLGEIFPDLFFRIVLEDGMFKIISTKLTAAQDCREVIKKLAAFHLQGFIRETDIFPEK